MVQPTLILDLDGTLADTMLDLIPVLNRTTSTFGLPPIDMKNVGHIVGHGAMAMIKRAFAFHGEALDDKTLERAFDLFIEDYSQNTCVNTVMFDGVDAALERFTAEGWLLAICTNKQEAMAVKLLKELNVHHRFMAITGGNTFDVRKPDPFHLTETVRLAGGDPAASVMVGDSVTDIDAAKNANIPVVAVDFGYSSEPVAIYEPDHIISHYDELHGAVMKIVAERLAD